MYILVDNTTSNVVGASIQSLVGDENFTVHEVLDGTTIDDIVNEDMKFTVRFNGSSFEPLSTVEIYPTKTGEEALAITRAKRDRLLKTQVDPLVTNILRWNEYSAADQQAIADYRTALLNITTDYPNAQYVYDEGAKDWVEMNITWPTFPTLSI